VAGISFDVRQGEIFGFLGPNGAGKTTAISCLAGLLVDWQGEMLLGGEPFLPARRIDDRRRVGLVPQEPAVYGELTGRENLRFFGRLNHLQGTALADAVREALDFAGLNDRADDLVEKYSGGMRRRLNFVAGTIVMMLMFGLMACSHLLLAERESGTLPRLLVAGTPRMGLLAGKYVFCIIIGLMQLAVLFTFGNAVFKIGAFRDPVTLTVLSVTWAVAAVSFGMLIACWARTTKQAEGLATLLILLMAAMGGCWFPVQMMSLPQAVEIATRCTLTYWAMSGYQGMFWEQWSWTHPQILTALGIQWGFAAVATLLAMYFYRRRYVAG